MDGRGRESGVTVGKFQEKGDISWRRLSTGDGQLDLGKIGQAVFQRRNRKNFQIYREEYPTSRGIGQEERR